MVSESWLYRNIEHPKIFRTLDMLLICCFLLNLGAVVITNALVFKTNTNVKLVEANPVTANTHQLETNKEALFKFSGFYIHALLWVFLAWFYIHKRNNVKNEKELLILTSIVISWLIILSLDFFNDFGYLLGKIMFG